MPVRGPAPNPCASCPYRQDVPPGVWSEEDYRKLEAYDRPTWDQPPGLFLCHQNGSGDECRRVCAGWCGTHGDGLLGLRLAAARPESEMAAGDVEAALRYKAPVPLFATGAEACAHGLSGIDDPTPAAVAMAAKIVARRPETAG